jgi:hypothetical protein
MTAFVVLASEGIAEKTWWNPYMKGALIAVLAIALFVGSAYLLLYTNVGSRLGFLLTASAFAGFMALLSGLWITAQFPQGPFGKAPGWDVKEIVPDLSASSYDAVHTIRGDGHPASAEQAGQIQSHLEVELTGQESEWKRFTVSEGSPGFLVTETLTEGGGRKWPLWWTEKTTYAVAHVCPSTVPKVPFGEPPAPAKCTKGEPTEFVVMLENLGALRQPSFFIFGGSLLLFALSLYALHVYERDQQRLGESAEVSAAEEESS